MSAKLQIRPYNPNLDSAALLPLWQAVLGDTWPMREDLLREMLTAHRFYRAGDHFVAVEGEQVVGFVGTQVDRSGEDEQECAAAASPSCSCILSGSGGASARGCTRRRLNIYGRRAWARCVSAAAARTASGRASPPIYLGRMRSLPPVAGRWTRSSGRATWCATLATIRCLRRCARAWRRSR